MIHVGNINNNDRNVNLQSKYTHSGGNLSDHLATLVSVVPTTTKRERETKKSECNLSIIIDSKWYLMILYRLLWHCVDFCLSNLEIFIFEFLVGVTCRTISILVCLKMAKKIYYKAEANPKLRAWMRILRVHSAKRF